MDPGRKRIEDREADFLAVGDRVLTEHGQEFEVHSVIPGCDYIGFVLHPVAEGAASPTYITLEPTDTMRVRVERR